MIKIKKLLSQEYLKCHNIISKNKEDRAYFENLGWKISQFKNQLSKENDFSLALFNNDLMISFVIGDIISIEKKIEYEISLIYVNIDDRNLGYASKLLNEIPSALNKYNLEKIYLEVSADNFQAIQLYKKNDFIQIGNRKNYYIFNNNKINALLFERKIYE